MITAAMAVIAEIAAIKVLDTKTPNESQVLETKKAHKSVPLFTGRRFERHVVRGVRIKRRVEINQIDAFGSDALSKHRKVVAVK
jgi:hypothetical protein